MIEGGNSKHESLIPGTSAYFNQLFETSSSPRVTALKQTKQNIVIAIDC